MYRKTPATNDTFCMASSVMHRFAINMPREPKWFRACAEGYLLSGRLNEICDHNATIARNAGRNDVCSISFSILLYESIALFKLYQTIKK